MAVTKTKSYFEVAYFVNENCDRDSYPLSELSDVLRQLKVKYNNTDAHIGIFELDRFIPKRKDDPSWNEPYRMKGPLLIEIDAKDLTESKETAIEVIDLLMAEYGLGEPDFNIKFSGNRSIHILIPYKVIPLNWSSELPKIFKKFVQERVVPKLNKPEVVDIQVYSHRHMIRQANSIHPKTNLYAIPLLYQDLKKDAVEIKELAKKERELKRGKQKKNSMLTSELRKIQQNIEKQASEIKKKDKKLLKKHVEEMPPCVRALLDAPKGQRNHYAFIYGAWLKQNGNSEEEIANELYVWNEQQDEPLPEQEIRSIINSVTTRDYSVGCSTQILKDHCGSPCPYFTKKIDPNKSLEELLFEEYVPTGLSFEELKELITKDLLAKDQNMKRNILAIANYLNENHHFKAPAYEKQSQLFLYNETKGIWEQNAYTFIDEFVRGLLLDHYSKAKTEAVYNHLMAMGNYISPEDFEEKNKNLICVLNGIYDIKSDTLIPHSPEHYFFSNVQINYDPNATCPEILKFIQEVQPEKINQDFLQEITGYVLYRGLPIHKFFVFEGEGRNGKGQYLKLIEAMLGKESCTHFDLTSLLEQNFARANLQNKYCNLCGDQSSGEIKKSGILKTITGDDVITADVKHGPQITFRNFAKLFVCCNELPQFNDKSLGFWDRYTLLSWNQQFRSQDYIDSITDPEEKARTHLAVQNIAEKLITPENMSGFFNWAIIGLKRAEECVRSNTSNERYVPKNEMFAYFKSWCASLKEVMYIPSSKALTIALENIGYVCGRKRIEGEERPYVWMNCELIPFSNKKKNNDSVPTVPTVPSKTYCKSIPKKDDLITNHWDNGDNRDKKPLKIETSTINSDSESKKEVKK